MKSSTETPHYLRKWISWYSWYLISAKKKGSVRTQKKPNKLATMHRKEVSKSHSMLFILILKGPRLILLLSNNTFLPFFFVDFWLHKLGMVHAIFHGDEDVLCICGAARLPFTLSIVTGVLSFYSIHGEVFFIWGLVCSCLVVVWFTSINKQATESSP